MNRKASSRMAMNGDRQVHRDRVFVGKLPKTTTPQELQGVFEKLGLKVKDVTINCAGDEHNYGFVTFPDDRTAPIAIDMAENNPLSVGGCEISVRHAFTSNRGKNQFFQRGTPPRGYQSHGYGGHRNQSPQYRRGNRPSSVGSPSPVPSAHSSNRSAASTPPSSRHSDQHDDAASGQHQHNNSNNYMSPLYNMNQYMYTTYAMGGMVANEQIYMHPPGYQRYPLYVTGSEYPTHQGQIPYCGSRIGGEILLPANPGIDASNIEPLSRRLQLVPGMMPAEMRHQMNNNPQYIAQPMPMGHYMGPAMAGHGPQLGNSGPLRC